MSNNKYQSISILCLILLYFIYTEQSTTIKVNHECEDLFVAVHQTNSNYIIEFTQYRTTRSNVDQINVSFLFTIRYDIMRSLCKRCNQLFISWRIWPTHKPIIIYYYMYTYNQFLDSDERFLFASFCNLITILRE